MDVTYLAASLAGVGLLVGLNVLLMRGRNAVADLTTLSARLRDEIPGFLPGVSVIAQTGAALCENEADGSIYLAVLRGDLIVTRKLNRDCRATRNAEKLALRFADFTLSKATIAFSDDQTAAQWEARIKRIVC